MGDFYYVILLMTTPWLIQTTEELETNDCPAKCDCLKQYVDCSKKNLISVPRLPQWAEQLDLSNNKLGENFTDAFEGLSTLTSLKLNKNDLHTIPRLHGLNRLHELSLNRNKIGIIDVNDFPVNSSLRILHLNSNKIVNIKPGALDNLINLVNLKLNRNSIRSLPSNLFIYCTKLKTLELGRNRLHVLNTFVFKGLDQLTTLKLRYNLIDNISYGAFFGFKSLNLLQLDHNNISSISKGWMYGLESMQTLSLSYNIISSIDVDSWELNSNLEEVDLSHNNIREIDSRTFQHLVSLKTLNLSGNKISSISQDSFGHIPQLKVLNLDNNKISWTVEDMTGPFSKLQNLQHFGLASNHIKSVNSRAFEGLTNLVELDLRGNNITSIQPHAFEPMTRLKKFHLNCTTLLCDCNLQSFSRWIRNNLDQKFVTATCAYPAELKGAFIAKLKDNDCGDSPKPKVVEHPKTHLAIIGHEANLVCAATSSPFRNMTFHWRKNNGNISNPLVYENITITGIGQVRAISVLVIKNVSHTDTGKYQCVVSNNFGTTYSSKAKITIGVFPSFTETPMNVTVKTGETVTLNCAATGEPQVEISWKKDGGNDFPAARERRMNVMPQDHLFFIVNAKTVDMGIYSCAAKNLAGTIISNATLTVLEAPSFVRVMENKAATSGDSVVLPCMVSGSPKPELKWTKDGAPIVSTERHYLTADDQLLVILNVEQSDAGHYECVIKNSLGTKKDMTELSILPPVAIMVNEEDMTGIIIITVVCSTVGTSIIWVVIIYHTRRRAARAVTTFPTENIKMTSQVLDSDSPQMFSDTNSERSSCKDSGTGDSAKRSSFDGVPNERIDHSHFESGVVHNYSVMPEAHQLLPSSFKPSIQVCVNTSISPATYSFSSHSDKDFS